MKYFMGFLAIFFVLCANAAGGVWYVDKDNVSGAEDGASWATAYTSIQPAVEAASRFTYSEVWVAGGNYTAATNPVLTMKANVSLYGGFTGTETARDQRDWQAHVTSIDGQNTHQCVVGASHATLDGFLITRGYNANNGGGMYNASSSPTVNNCVFTRNSSLNGGGMYNASSSPTVSNCTVTDNSAT